MHHYYGSIDNTYNLKKIDNRLGVAYCGISSLRQLTKKQIIQNCSLALDNS